MIARDELRRMVAEKLDQRMATLEQATDAVMTLFHAVSSEVDEIDITTHGDRREQRTWTRWLVARVVQDSGQYEGPPRG